MLEGYFYDGEVPSSTTLSDMLCNVIVGAECHDLCDGAESLVAGLIKAWVGAKEHEQRDNEDFDLQLVTGAEAEKLYGNAFRKVYCDRLYHRAPSDDDEIGWWPDCLNYNGLIPRRLLLKVAKIIGAVEADRSRATFRYMREMSAKKAV